MCQYARVTVDKETKELFALKKIYLNSEEEGIPSTAIREIALLKELDHVNVVKLHNVIHYKQRLILVFEYCNEDLKHFISSFKDEDIPMKVIKNFMYQTFKGMAHCHQSKILHRDLKPPNILVSNVSSADRRKKSSSWPTSVWQEPPACQSRTTPTRWSLCGTGRLTCCWATHSTTPASTSGVWGASWPRWPTRSRC